MPADVVCHLEPSLHVVLVGVFLREGGRPVVPKKVRHVFGTCGDVSVICDHGVQRVGRSRGLEAGKLGLPFVVFPNVEIVCCVLRVVGSGGCSVFGGSSGFCSLAEITVTWSCWWVMSFICRNLCGALSVSIV